MLSVSEGNPWVASVSMARRQIPGWVALVIAAALFALTLWSAPRLHAQFAGAVHGMGEGGARLLVSLCYFLPMNLPAFLLFFFYERRPWPHAGRMFAGFGALAGGFAFLAALFIACGLGVVRYVGTSPYRPPFSEASSCRRSWSG